MLFPKSPEVTRVWKRIVYAVTNNRLGPTAKVATDDGSEERLICVYTKVSSRFHDMGFLLKTANRTLTIPTM